MRKIQIFKIACILQAAAMTTACSVSDFGDSQLGDKCPVLLKATVSEIEPMSRVKDGGDYLDGMKTSSWSEGDEINVSVNGQSDGTEGVYKLHADGSVDETGTTPVYWPTKGSVDITAWYPKGHRADLSDQSQRLTYVLKGTATGTYNNPLTLNFKHQLAKLKVYLKGGDGPLMKITKLSVYGCTGCTFGMPGAEMVPESENYIPMQVYYDDLRVANLVPGKTIQKDAFMITINGVTKKISLDSPLTPEAGKCYTINLTLNPKYTIVPPEGGNYSSGYPLMNGTNYTGTVTISGTAVLTLNHPTASNALPIRVAGGSPIILVNGYAHLTSTGDQTAVIQGDGENANITIIGKRDDSYLVLKKEKNKIGAGIGSCAGGVCGDITIRNVGISIDMYENSGSAGIGGGNSGSCGKITISNSSHLTISKVVGAAAVGCGLPLNKKTVCKGIDISSIDQISLETGNYFNFYPAAIGGSGAVSPDNYSECGDITIQRSGNSEAMILLNISEKKNYSEDVGLGAVEESADKHYLIGKVGTITWKKWDGTVTSVTAPRYIIYTNGAPKY